MSFAGKVAIVTGGAQEIGKAFTTALLNIGMKGYDIHPVYCGTKFAVIGFTKSYGTDYHLKRTGVTVNAICPGPVRTDLLQVLPTLTLDEEWARKVYEDWIPVNSEDIARALLRLLQDGKNGALLKVSFDDVSYA